MISFRAKKRGHSGLFWTKICDKILKLTVKMCSSSLKKSTSCVKNLQLSDTKNWPLLLSRRLLGFIPE